jgi:Putative serine esterase (DUF676)
MKFRDLYNLVQEHPPCHRVIEKELETITNSNKALWDAYLTILPRLSSQILPILKKEADSLAEERLSILINHKTHISTSFLTDFDEQYLKFYKEDPEFQRVQDYFQLQLTEVEKKARLVNSHQQPDPKTSPYFYELECIKVSDAEVPEFISTIPAEAPVSESGNTQSERSTAEGDNQILPESTVQNEQKAAPQAEPAVRSAVDLLVVCPSISSSGIGMSRLMLALHRHLQPGCFYVHNSVANDGDASAHLYLMSLRLAEEVKALVGSLHTRGACLRTIGFVGVGTGGLVVRGALKDLEEYKQKFGIFMTLGTPHIGNADVKENILGKGRLQFIYSWWLYRKTSIWRHKK